MITYQISTGVLVRDNLVLGQGYSGQPGCKNDPSKCNVHDRGPIPPGGYTIGTPRDTETHGPFVLPLIPKETNEMFERTGFLMHGDSITHPGTASHGCIVVSRAAREAVHATKDTELEVIP